MAKEYTKQDYANDVKFVFTYSKLGPNATERQKLNAMRLLTAVKPMVDLNTRRLPKNGYLPMKTIDRMLDSPSEIRDELQERYGGPLNEKETDMKQLEGEVQEKMYNAINKLYPARFNGAVTRIKRFARPPVKPKKKPEPKLEQRLGQGSLFDNPVRQQTESDHLTPEGNKR